MKGSSQDNALMNLTDGPIAKTLLVFSIPFVISTLLQTLYSTVDTIVVGQFMGSVGLSAVSNGSQLIQVIYMLCIGFSTAGQVMLAQSKGAGNDENVQKTIGTLCHIMLVLSVALGAFCMIFATPFLILLDTPPEAFNATYDYVMICGGGIIFTGFFNMFSAILRGLGDSRHPLIFVAIASVVNLVLDYVFIACFHWGVAGAALATIIGQACSVIFSIVYLSKHAQKLGFHFSVKELRYDAQNAKEMFKLGLPMALQSCAVQFSFLFVSRLMNGLGLVASAAFGVSQKIRNIPHILTQGLGMGASSMIGQNLGAKRNDRVSSTINWGMLVCGVINTIFAAVFLLYPEACFRAFTPDADVLAYAPMCMLALTIELPGKIIMPMCNALVSAQGFVSFSMTLSIIDAFIGRVLFSWFLGTALGFGAQGYFLGYTIATYFTAIPVFVYYLTGRWKKRALLVE